MIFTDLSEISTLLSTPKNIIITGHRNPDADALGSTLGLSLFLQQKGHKTTVIYPSDYPYFLDWMPEVDDTLIYEYKDEEANSKIDVADIVFFLDFNALDRIDKLGDYIGAKTCTKIMIDHHMYPENCADFIFSDTSASSTCEMVFDFIMALKEGKLLNLDIAECLYAGILSDTGSFRHATSSKLFRKVADLIDLGLNDNKIQMLVNDQLSEKSIKLLGHCLNNRMQVFEEFKSGLIYLSNKDYENFDIQRGDTEGIVNYLLKMKNVNFAALITHQKNIVKFSLRSKGDFSAQEIASTYFNGGGHHNASGGYMHSSLHDAIEKFKNILPLYKQKLNNVKL